MDSLSNERRDQEQVSVLDALGDGITGIAWPVSLCMAITIFLVSYILDPYHSAFSLSLASHSFSLPGARPQSARQQQLIDRIYSSGSVSGGLQCR